MQSVMNILIINTVGNEPAKFVIKNKTGKCVTLSDRKCKTAMQCYATRVMVFIIYRTHQAVNRALILPNHSYPQIYRKYTSILSSTPF